MSLHDIAWSTRSASNGKITRTSRWHISKSLIVGTDTLCGERIPHEKHFTSKPTFMVRGGDCAACKAAAAKLSS